jgi:hypothetical protein
MLDVVAHDGAHVAHHNDSHNIDTQHNFTQRNDTELYYTVSCSTLIGIIQTLKYWTLLKLLNDTSLFG